VSKGKGDETSDGHWFVKALAHPLRIEILEILNEREASPREMSVALDAPLSSVSYHVGVLSECGCVEEMRSKPKRGALEHFYRATSRSSIGHQDVRQVPRAIRNMATGSSLDSFLQQAYAAIGAGKVDDPDDTLWSCMHLAVDEAGWQRVAEIGKEALAECEEAAAKSRQRARKTGKPLVPMIVALAAFETSSGQGSR
jgi:DNA-binding transcriptional ArsR family regulator